MDGRKRKKPNRLKTELDAVKLSLRDIGKSLTYTQSEVEELKEHFEMERNTRKKWTP